MNVYFAFVKNLASKYDYMKRVHLTYFNVNKFIKLKRENVYITFINI